MYLALGEILDVKHGFPFGGEYFRDEPSGNALPTPGNFAIGGGFKERSSSITTARRRKSLFLVMVTC